MLVNAVLTLGLMAIAAGAPVGNTAEGTPAVTMTHTVAIDEPTPTMAGGEVGAGVGYGPAPPVQTEAFTTEHVTATTSESVVPPCATIATTATDSVHIETPTHAAAAAAPMQTETPTGTSAAANSTAVEQPVAPVVPVHICTNNGTRCLTTVGSEFADIALSFDNVATFSLGMDGLLVRLNDLKCVDAVPMDGATWYDLEYVNCTLPNYLEGALALDGNGIDAPGSNVTEQAEDRAAKLTAVATATSTADSTATETPEADAPTTEMHTIWFYNTTTSHLCANVNDGLNDIALVCMYSDEGYAMLGTKEELKNVARKNREVTMPVVNRDNSTLSEQLARMLRAMTYDGSVFWANAWDTNIETVMKYRMMPQEQDINMGRDEMTGIVYPLWQVINDCRSTCDTYAWCRSFTFHIHERVCTLSSNQPEVHPDQLNVVDPDMVTFSQNKNYNREDFVLPEDIKTDIPQSRRRRVVHRL